MSLEVQGHTCTDAGSSTTDDTDDTDASDNFYGHYDCGGGTHGAFIDRASILNKLQAIQRLKMEKNAKAKNSCGEQWKVWCFFIEMGYI